MAINVLVWQAVCEYDQQRVSMVISMQAWQTVCEYGKQCVSMASSEYYCRVCSLSANHDGIGYGNECGKGYVMQASQDVDVGSEKIFQFSPCTITRIKRMLQDLRK